MSRSRSKQKNRPEKTAPNEVEPFTVSLHSAIALDSTQFFWSEWDTLKAKGSWTIGTAEEVKLYNATTISEDMTELISVAHRTEGKVDDNKTILEKIAEKLEVSMDGDTEQDEMMCLDVSDDEAREMIIQHLRGKGVTYPSDIAGELNLNYDQVGRVLRQLEEEGVIEPHES